MSCLMKMTRKELKGEDVVPVGKDIRLPIKVYPKCQSAREPVKPGAVTGRERKSLKSLSSQVSRASAGTRVSIAIKSNGRRDEYT